MIDLNRQNKKRPVIRDEEEPPIFVQMLLMLPFVALLWWVFTQGFINGIY